MSGCVVAVMLRSSSQREKERRACGMYTNIPVPFGSPSFLSIFNDETMAKERIWGGMNVNCIIIVICMD